MTRKKQGTATAIVHAIRGVGSSMAPCDGYLSYRENANGTGSDFGSFEQVYRALGRHIEPGSTIRLEVTVTVLNEKPRSKKKCHNPWPAHMCRNRRRKK